MRRKILTALLLLLPASMQLHAAEPEEILNAYFDILTNRNYAGISDLMAEESMNHLKAAMDKAMVFQHQHDRHDLEERIFGKHVSLAQVAETPASFYLEALAEEILRAATRQELLIVDRTIIGKVNETEDMVHIVARLTMRQHEHQIGEVLVYTLVREGDGWKLKFPVTIRQMLGMIENAARNIR